MDMRISDGGSGYLAKNNLRCNIIIFIETINEVYAQSRFGSRSPRRPSSGSQSALQSIAVNSAATPDSCATAFGARYASQQVSRQGRKYLQSQRLRRFLGEYPNLGTIHKPLFMHRKTYGALLTKLRHIEANPKSRKYKSKRLAERVLKPNNMYQVEVAHIADA